MLYGASYKSIKFHVTKGNAGNLLSYKDGVKLGAINKINQVDSGPPFEAQKWKAKYPEAFREEVGAYKNYEVKLHIDETIRPRQEKLRHVSSEGSS